MTIIITESRLHAWVVGNSRDAQEVIVELISRLINESCPKPNERHFSLSIDQHGPDGVLDTDTGFNPFVPQGRSYWEIGTGIDAGKKATTVYRDLTNATPKEVRRESTFVFVTPLSGTQDWQYTWKEKGKLDWIKRRLKLKEWKDVRVIDGTILTDWLSCFPPIELWLAGKMGHKADRIETVEQRWSDLRDIGSPPPLITNIFLANRENACTKLRDVFAGVITQLQLDTHYPGQMADFVAAYVESMNNNDRMDAIGRSLIVLCAEVLNGLVTSLHEQHVFIADFDLDDAGPRLLSRASKARHSIIFWGSPGGSPTPYRALLPNPKTNQIKEALEKAGYHAERARTLSQKCGGNLDNLLRLLQRASIMPEWAQGTDTAELVVAEFLGSWSEHFEADKAVAERLSGNAYGEWIRKIQEIVLRPNTPLSHHNDIWKFNERFEGWYSLGPKLFDADLDRFKDIAVKVLRERDPKFELPPDKRFAANIYGKVLSHSYSLRSGLAESLALMGSHHDALKFCSKGKAETIAALAVHEILSDSDWVSWASLDNLLPLLAEAAPNEFLNAVENALNSDRCPFNEMFEQRESGLTFNNYLTDLLWALETLAWDADYLINVVVQLGKLAAKNLGEGQGNSPENSLSTILLPWFPQTCAPVAKRVAAVKTLINEFPDVAWKTLLSFLPQDNQITSGSYKPSWRDIIPDDWVEGATPEEYLEQITAYVAIAIDLAKKNCSRLAELIDRFGDLWPEARTQVLGYLSSDSVVSLQESERVRLWAELTNIVCKHKKFAGAKWAMKPEQVDEIAIVADKLAPNSPIYRHQRLFSESDHDLYEERGDYKEQQKALEDRRQKAIVEIFEEGGIEAILDFAKAVRSPWRVGFSFGVIAPNKAELLVLPNLLESENKSIFEFAGGFVRGRFWTHQWQWVDGIDISKWTPEQKGQFLAFLPFSSDTWERMTRYLGDEESFYWSKASVNPLGSDQNLERAIDQLVNNNRAHEALICFEQMLYKNRTLNNQQAIRVLQAIYKSSESIRKMDANITIDVIKALQDDPNTNPNDLFQIEWAFLPLLDRFHDASPKCLERQLADDPAFFCDVIRHAFRSKKEDKPVEEPTEEQKNLATSAYHLLHYWRSPPGTQKNGTFNGDALNAWLGKVKDICCESGHLEVALTVIGQVLFSAPHDPDGFWIHNSVARILNEEESGKMRTGFYTAIIASRGVYFSTGGDEERKLSLKYLSRADELEERGYHRLANTYREVAAFYEREAEQEASRVLFEEY